MTALDPPSSLDGSCTVIYDNVLYSYTPDNFLSLPLREGAKWRKLANGESAAGAKCVGTTASEPAFYTVGGVSDNPDFTGLQKFTYATGEWTTITPSILMTKNRQWHSVAYLKDINRLVVFAGDQDGNYTPSIVTFSIDLTEPYTVEPYVVDGLATPPQPLLQPILLSWSGADAVLVGGDAGNTKVFLFNPLAGWRDYGASLAEPIPRDTSSIQGVMVNGDDGSKNLITFDMTQSPNLVQRVVLADASGSPVANSAPVRRRNSRSVSMPWRRDLTLDDWPEYNSTLAPSTTRENYAMAASDDGMVVFSGGNAEEPIAMFDMNENSWMNATAALVAQSMDVSGTLSSTSSASSTSTRSLITSITEAATTTTADSGTTTAAIETTAAATSDAAATTGDSSEDDGMSSNAVLGITLGSIAGFIIILGLILLCLRRRKLQKLHTEAGHARRASGLAMDMNEKHPAGFTTDALPPRSPTHFRGHHPQLSQESYSSMAILMGRMGQQKPGLSRKGSKDSGRSSVSSLHKQFKSTISKPVLQDNRITQMPDERGVAFAPGVAPPRPRNPNTVVPDGTRRSSGWNRYWSGGSALQLLGFGGAKRATSGSERSSRYSENNHNPRITQDSATVPPLNFDGRPEVNSVNTGSPIVSQHPSHVPAEGMMGTIERPVSKASSGYSSGIPESVNDSWEPSDTSSKPWGSERAPSSAYVPSFFHGTSLAPSDASTRHAPSRPAHSGVSRQPQLAMASQSSDMSWLNLGDNSKV